MKNEIALIPLIINLVTAIILAITLILLFNHYRYLLPQHNQIIQGENK